MWRKHHRKTIGGLSYELSIFNWSCCQRGRGATTSQPSGKSVLIMYYRGANKNATVMILIIHTFIRGRLGQTERTAFVKRGPYWRGRTWLNTRRYTNKNHQEVTDTWGSKNFLERTRDRKRTVPLKIRKVCLWICKERNLHFGRIKWKEFLFRVIIFIVDSVVGGAFRGVAAILFQSGHTTYHARVSALCISSREIQRRFKIPNSLIMILSFKRWRRCRRRGQMEEREYVVLRLASREGFKRQRKYL